MLSLNLHNRRSNIYRNGKLYDLLYPGFKGDSDYYCQKAKKGDTLYFGIGTGRIFSKIFKHNNKAIGLDNSPFMLKILFERCPEIPKENIIFSDVLTASFKDASFDTIIAPYAFLNFFEYSQIVKILKKTKRWLRPKGKFVTDVFSPFKNPPFRQNQEVITNGNGLSTEIIYNHITQEIFELSLISIGDKKASMALKNYYYYPNELIRAIKEAGMKVTSVKSNYTNKPLSTDSDVIVINASRL
jgi:SAM-dependent methyltransferase